jgi:hypothetical protein
MLVSKNERGSARPLNRTPRPVLSLYERTTPKVINTVHEVGWSGVR